MSLLALLVSPGQKWKKNIFLLLGEHEKPGLRIRAIVGGFIKYGECVRNDVDSFCFPDQKSHDEYVRVLLPYARNVSAVEQMLEANEQAGQMTTQSLGFSQ